MGLKNTGIGRTHGLTHLMLDGQDLFPRFHQGLFQAFYLLECRSLHASLFRMSPRGNPWVWAGIAAVLVLQAAFVYAEPMQEVFGSAALGAGPWLRLAEVRAADHASPDAPAQAATTRRVPEWTQWTKLRSLAEGAALANEAVTASA